jgi:hypothetical protein
MDRKVVFWGSISFLIYLNHNKISIVKLNFNPMKKIYTIFLILTLALLSNTAFAQYNLLWVGDFTNDGDTLVIDYLEEAGYTVTVITDDEFTGYIEASNYDGYDCVFISEIVGSGNTVAFRTAGYPLPCVTTEGYTPNVGRWDWIETADQFLQVATPDLDDGIKTLIIDDGEHYITKWYGEEAEVDWTSIPDVTAAVGGTVNPVGTQLDLSISDAIQLGHLNNAAMEQHPIFWAIPAGSSPGHLDPPEGISNNVVVFGIHQNGLTGGFHTPEYFDLILRSIQWVTDNPSSVEDLTDNKRNDLGIMPNPTSGTVNLSFAMATSGKVQIDIYDITGKRVETIESGYLGAGQNTLTIDLSDMSNGQYIVRLKTFDNVLTRKVLKTQ